MRTIKLIDIVVVAIALVPFIIFLVLRDSLPDRMPIHWNPSGVADGWAEKNQVPGFLGIMAAAGVGAYLLLRFVKRIDPKRTAKLNDRAAAKIGIGIVLFMSVFSILLLFPKTGSLNIVTIVLILVSLLFTFIGNLMYNIKPNYFIGIRLPWTLENEENWKLTHRLAGVIWFIGGIISAALALVMEPKSMFAIFIGITVLLVLIPSVYSFLIFKRTKTSH